MIHPFLMCGAHCPTEPARASRPLQSVGAGVHPGNRIRRSPGDREAGACTPDKAPERTRRAHATGTALHPSRAVYGRRARPAVPEARFESWVTGRRRDANAYRRMSVAQPSLQKGRYAAARPRRHGKDGGRFKARHSDDVMIARELTPDMRRVCLVAGENDRRRPEDSNAATGTMTVHRAPPKISNPARRGGRHVDARAMRERHAGAQPSRATRPVAACADRG